MPYGLKRMSAGLLILVAVIAMVGASSTTATAATTLTAGSYQEVDPGVEFSGAWKPLANPADAGSASVYANENASFTVTFRGTGIAWVGRRSPSSGIATVTIDGKQVGSVDRYSSINEFQQQLFVTTDLPLGTHVLTVTADGRKNAAATGSSHHLDAVVVFDGGGANGPGVYEENSSALEFTGTWATHSSSLDSGGASVSAGGPATVTLQFEGDEVEWLGRRATSGGIAEVILDGKRLDDVDRRASSSQYQQSLLRLTGLGAGSHVLTISWSSDNTQTSGSRIHLDALIVRKAADPAPAGTYEESSKQLLLSGPWIRTQAALDSGGSSMYSSSAASASLTFDGSAVQWVGRRSASSGIAEVLIDGKVVKRVDRYSATNEYRQVLFEQQGLAAGTHTITVRWTGEAASAATSNAIHFDAFVVEDVSDPSVATAGVVDESDPLVRYRGGWTSATHASDWGGTSKYASASSSATLTFEGTGIAWVARTTPTSGIASVTIDGVRQDDVDRYSAKTEFQKVVFRKTDLEPGRHTITVAWTSKDGAGPAGGAMHMDAFVVSDGRSLAAPSGLRVLPAGQSLLAPVSTAIAWDAVEGIGAADAAYVLRRIAPGGEVSEIIGLAQPWVVDRGLLEATKYTYEVLVRDRWGFQSPVSNRVERTTGTVSVVGAVGSSRCGTPTQTVATASALTSAINAAEAGDVIKLQPGVYRGQVRANGTYNGFTISGLHGTRSAPITLCGDPGASIDLGGSATTYSNLVTALRILDSSWIRLEGLNVTRSHIGIEMIRSNNVIVDRATVSDTAQEAIHLKENSTSNVVANSTVRRTGHRDARFGEGIYVGSSLGNDVCEPNCPVDASDNNLLLANVFVDTTAEGVEVKEQSSGNVIYGNTFGALKGTNDLTGATVQVKGNNSEVYGNDITASLPYGVRLLAGAYPDGHTWGVGNVIAQNRITFTNVSSASLAIWRDNRFLNAVACANDVEPGTVPLTTGECAP